jgi:hypothetical protein
MHLKKARAHPPTPSRASCRCTFGCDSDLVISEVEDRLLSPLHTEELPHEDINGEVCNLSELTDRHLRNAAKTDLAAYRSMDEATLAEKDTVPSLLAKLVEMQRRYQEGQRTGIEPWRLEDRKPLRGAQKLIAELTARLEQVAEARRDERDRKAFESERNAGKWGSQKFHDAFWAKGHTPDVAMEFFAEQLKKGFTPEQIEAAPAKWGWVTATEEDEDAPHAETCGCDECVAIDVWSRTPRRNDESIKECPQCAVIAPGGARKCLECGYVWKQRKRSAKKPKAPKAAQPARNLHLVAR